MASHHNAPEQRIQELDDILSRLNALEVSTTDEFQLSIITILRSLVRGQMHSISEMDHYRKALDLVTLQAFKARQDDR